MVCVLRDKRYNFYESCISHTNTSTEIVVFQARFEEWKLRISCVCSKLIKVARKSGGTRLKSHSKGLKSRSNGLKSYSNGLKSKQGPLLSIKIQMQLSVVWTNSTQLSVACLTKRKLNIFFSLNELENTTLFSGVIGKSTVFDTSWKVISDSCDCSPRAKSSRLNSCWTIYYFYIRLKFAIFISRNGLEIKRL